MKERWEDSAACAGVDPEPWHPGYRKHGAEAKAICRGCPVRQECLEDALAQEKGRGATTRYGIRGAMGPRERWELQRVRDREGAR